MKGGWCGETQWHVMSDEVDAGADADAFVGMGMGKGSGMSERSLERNSSLRKEKIHEHR